MSSATTPPSKRHLRGRGLATLRRMKQDIISAFSGHTQPTLVATCSTSGKSIYNERLLSGNQIRVLHIQPSSDPNRQLECELELVNLDDEPSYEALSYVWGVDPPSVPIICNGQPLTIRPELSYGLARLRLKHSTRIIWADALCIDQTDNQEKSLQVPLMGKIFSQATKVNVWLGYGDNNVIAEAFDCCIFIANACREFGGEHCMDPDKEETLKAVEIPITVFTPMVCSSLTELFNRPLFSRVWCIQEILLAKDAVVLWGERELPWVDVGRAAQWALNKWFVSEVDGEWRDLLCENDPANVYAMFASDLVGASLLDILADFRYSQSTDPRDKVYGLISLIGSRADIDTIIPDYEKSVAQVFADAALRFLVDENQLRAFFHVQHQENYDGGDGYRSWAPRWDHLPTAVKIGGSGIGFGDGACGGRTAQFATKKDSESGQLYLTGVSYDIVTTVDIVFENDDFERPGGFERFHQVAKLYETIDLSNSNYDMALHAVGRTLTAGFDTDFRPLQSKDHDNEALCTYYEASRKFFQWWHTPMMESRRLDGDALRYQYAAKSCCRQRCLFGTSQEDYGLGPECMRVGDVVVVLYGGTIPYVLRPKGDKYLLLGGAHVDSIMHGELVKEFEEGKRQEQVFCLI